MIACGQLAVLDDIVWLVDDPAVGCAKSHSMLANGCAHGNDVTVSRPICLDVRVVLFV